MSKQTISLGTAPTGTGGDTPRTAFTKAQNNFDELYAALGASGNPQALPPALPVLQGGTGVTTIAALLAALAAAGAYAKGNVVGAVSQSGGVNTGAIVEYGSNGNGEYWKFAGGMMLCKGAVGTSVAASTVSQYAYTLPAAFANTDYFAHAMVQPLSSADFYGAVFKVNTSTTQVQFGFRNGAAAQNISGHWFALGRWYV